MVANSRSLCYIFISKFFSSFNSTFGTFWAQFLVLGVSIKLLHKVYVSSISTSYKKLNMLQNLPIWNTSWRNDILINYEWPGYNCKENFLSYLRSKGLSIAMKQSHHGPISLLIELINKYNIGKKKANSKVARLKYVAPIMYYT